MSAVSLIVVGAPRSGTYWIVDLLQARFGLCIPSETHFAPLFSRFLWLWGDLSKASNRRRLLINIYEFLQIWTPRSAKSEEYVAQIRQLSLLVTLDEGRGERIIEESSDYVSLIEALYRHFADIHGTDLSGDKSAHYRVLDPDRIFNAYPRSKMLHVVRDGRDVASSWLKQWFGPSDLTEAAGLWCEHIEVNRDWGERNPQRYLEVRYEDLATSLETEIDRIGHFLGRRAVPEQVAVEESLLARALSKTNSHAGMLEINADENVAKWQTEMSEHDKAVFEKLAGATLISSGYEALVCETDGVVRHWPRFSAHTARVTIKTWLPLILGISSVLRFPFLRVANRKFPEEWVNIAIGPTSK